MSGAANSQNVTSHVVSQVLADAEQRVLERLEGQCRDDGTIRLLDARQAVRSVLKGGAE